MFIKTLHRGKGFNLEWSSDAEGLAEAKQKLEGSELLIREAIDSGTLITKMDQNGICLKQWYTIERNGKQTKMANTSDQW